MGFARHVGRASLPVCRNLKDSKMGHRRVFYGVRHSYGQAVDERIGARRVIRVYDSGWESAIDARHPGTCGVTETSSSGKERRVRAWTMLSHRILSWTTLESGPVYFQGRGILTSHFLVPADGGY